MTNGNYLPKDDPERARATSFTEDINTLKYIFDDYIVSRVGAGVFEHVESMRRHDADFIDAMLPDTLKEYTKMIAESRQANLADVFRDELGDSRNESAEDAATSAVIKGLIQDKQFDDPDTSQYQEAFGLISSRFKETMDHLLGDSRISDLDPHSPDAFSFDGLIFCIEINPDNIFEVVIVCKNDAIRTLVYEVDKVNLLDVMSAEGITIPKEKIDLLPLFGSVILGVDFNDLTDNAVKALHIAVTGIKS